MNWLLDRYKNQIPTAVIGKVLDLVTPVMTIYSREENSYPPIVERLLKEYPDLTAKDVMPAVEKAARFNSKLFEIYLNHFTQLESQHLQKILNDTSAYGLKFPESHSAASALLIRQKFPEMKVRQ